MTQSFKRKPKRDCIDCDCPWEADPYGTGDIWFQVQHCENPYNCPHDSDSEDDEDEEESEQ